jgi:hypothetical protein
MAKQKAWVTFFQTWSRVFNILFMIGSCLIIIFGTTAYKNSSDAQSLAPTLSQLNIKSTSLILLVIGVFALICTLIGALGFFPRIKVKIIQLYAVFIGIMCFLQLGLGAYLASVGANNNNGAVNQKMVDSAVFDGSPDAFQAYANYFSCCDWTINQPWVVGTYVCKVDQGFDTLCLDATASWIKDKIYIVAILSVITSIVEILGAIGTCIFIFGRAKQPEDDDD